VLPRTALLDRLSRIGIAATALLYVAVTSVDPLLHPAAPGGADASVLVTTGGEHPESPGDPRSHADAECLLCKVAGAHSTGASQAQPVVASPTRALTPAAAVRSGAPAFLLPQPRAPPLV